MAQTIHSFNGTLLAFYRPIKRTYYFLKWDDGNRRWEPYSAEHTTPFTLHKSSAHQPGGVIIKIKMSGVRRYYSTRITCDTHFLKSGELSIPIAKAAQPMTPSKIKREYTATPLDDNNLYLRHTDLWTLATPAVPPASPPPSAVTRVKLVPIPRRIAWLIAEDACKNKETCSISLEEISPITASVTTCFHVFDTDSLNTWLNRSTTTAANQCPVCRTPCLPQKAFEEEPAAPAPAPAPATLTLTLAPAPAPEQALTPQT
jgi:hypothetical protein